jgi:hypothetical protein
MSTFKIDHCYQNGLTGKKRETILLSSGKLGGGSGINYLSFDLKIKGEN